MNQSSDTPTLAQIKARHVKVTRGNGAHCQMCSYVSRGYYVEWPCDAFTLLQEVERRECDVKSYMEDWQLEYKLHHETKQKLAQAEVSNYDLRRYTDVLNESRAKAEARCRELEQAQLAELWCPSMGKCQQIIENLQDQLKQQEGTR